jgi:hypothetical protein
MLNKREPGVDNSQCDNDDCIPISNSIRPLSNFKPNWKTLLYIYFILVFIIVFLVYKIVNKFSSTLSSARK